MELVYLWVEEYKNIHKQGFNFSPRFECEYDGTNLTITPTPEKAIENFFDEDGNINITAIVGKNGSGKSNILELLFNHKILEHKSREHFFIIETKEGLYLYYFQNTRLKLVKIIELEKEYKIIDIRNEAKKSSNAKYNFSAIYFSNIYQKLPIHDERQYEEFHNITTSYLINKYSIDIANNKFISYKWQYDFYLSKSIENALIMLKNSFFELPFDKPTQLNIVLNNSYVKEDIKGIEKLYNDQEDLVFSEIAKRNIIFNYYHNYLDNENIFDKEEFTKKINTFDKDYIENTYQLIKESPPFLDSEVDNFLKSINTDNSKDIISMDIKDIDEHFITNLEKLNKATTIFNCIDVFHFNWSPNLSTGEEAFLFQFANFYNVIKDNEEKNIMILIDEGETTMHPNWQKKYLNYYIEFFKNNFKDKDQKFHLILTSHSPFLISDLPKENIIFLKDGEQVYPFENKQTFGANIHTLLSDGFFMDDGLMGEFAKGKINEIKKFYEKVIKYQNKPKIKKAYLCFYTQKSDYFFQIKNIIGEPFLKIIIGNYLTEIEKILIEDKAEENEISRFIEKFGNDKIQSFLKKKND